MIFNTFFLPTTFAHLSNGSKLVIVATDLGGLTDTLRVTVPIDHNQFSPTFQEENYSRTIYENHALADSVVQIRATDLDRQVRGDIERM